jgi:hypothetical protein
MKTYKFHHDVHSYHYDSPIHVSSLHEYIIVYELTESYSFICIMKICRFSGIMPKNADNTLSHTICAIVSDSLSQDTVSVHLHQEHLVQFIMRKVEIKSNQFISITCVIDLLLSIRIEQFSSVCVSMRRRMGLLNCQLHLLAHKEELQPSDNDSLSVTQPVYAHY